MMHILLHITLIVASALLVGCGPSSSPNPTSAASSASATNAWPFEGEYIDANYNDRPTVTFEGGHYRGSWFSNPGGDMNGSGKYTVRETGVGKWELDFQYDHSERKTVLFIRKEGDDIVIRDASFGGETRLVGK